MVASDGSFRARLTRRSDTAGREENAEENAEDDEEEDEEEDMAREFTALGADAITFRTFKSDVILKSSLL